MADENLKNRVEKEGEVGTSNRKLSISNDIEEEIKGDLTLTRMFELIKDLIQMMNASCKIQKNVNKVVKNGLPIVEKLFDRFQRGDYVDAPKQGEGSVNTPVGPGAKPLPPTTDGKRKASCSPTLPIPRETKRQRSRDPPKDSWTEVVKRGKKKKPKSVDNKGLSDTAKTNTVTKKPKRSKRQKPEAVLIRPGEGKSYADVISSIRKELKPEETGVEIRSARKTRAGEVLLELHNSNVEKRATFSEALKRVAGGVSIRQLVPTTTLEVMDIDCCTVDTEVEEAIKRALPTYSGSLKVTVTRANVREQKVAIIQIEEEAAKILMKAARLRVGFICCRIRHRKVVDRCYRCLSFGHQSRSCKGPDRSKLCFKCGQTGHKATNCQEKKPMCFLCKEKNVRPEEQNHASGSASCVVWREALARTVR